MDLRPDILSRFFIIPLKSQFFPQIILYIDPTRPIYGTSSGSGAIFSLTIPILVPSSLINGSRSGSMTSRLGTNHLHPYLHTWPADPSPKPNSTSSLGWVTLASATNADSIWVELPNSFTYWAGRLTLNVTRLNWVLKLCFHRQHEMYGMQVFGRNQTGFA